MSIYRSYSNQQPYLEYAVIIFRNDFSSVFFQPFGLLWRHLQSSCEANWNKWYLLSVLKSIFMHNYTAIIHLSSTTCINNKLQGNVYINITFTIWIHRWVCIASSDCYSWENFTVWWDLIVYPWALWKSGIIIFFCRPYCLYASVNLI